MILVDTSIWVEHLKTGSARLRALLHHNQVLCHPFVMGELVSRVRDSLTFSGPEGRPETPGHTQPWGGWVPGQPAGHPLRFYPAMGRRRGEGPSKCPKIRVPRRDAPALWAAAPEQGWPVPGTRANAWV